MNRDELDRALDKWLDQSAAEYGRAEIRPGAEARITAKLKSRLAKRRWHFRWIPIAAAFAVILFFLVYLPRNQSEDRETADILDERDSVNEPAPAQNPELAGKQARSLGSSQARVQITESSTMGDARQGDFQKAREAKGGRFMSSGLSNRERYLIDYVQATSKAPVPNISAKTVFNPLEINQLKIKEAQIPEFRIQDFKISSFEMKATPITTPGREEQI